jgi:hypothetical protein
MGMLPTLRAAGVLAPTATTMGEPVSISLAVAGACAAIVSWLGAAAVTALAALGLSGPFVAAACSALAAAGVAAASGAIVTGAGAVSAKAVQAIAAELDDDETDEAKYANEFYAEQWDKEYTSRDAVIAFIADFKRRTRNDKLAMMIGLKVWARYSFIHEPAPFFIEAGIAKNKGEIIAANADMIEGKSADAKYAADFYSETWDAQYTSTEAVLAFIKGLQQRQGHRAGLECGLKVWQRWRLLIEPKLLAAKAERDRTRYAAIPTYVESGPSRTNLTKNFGQTAVTDVAPEPTRMMLASRAPSSVLQAGAATFAPTATSSAPSVPLTPKQKKVAIGVGAVAVGGLVLRQVVGGAVLRGLLRGFMR